MIACKTIKVRNVSDITGRDTTTVFKLLSDSVGAHFRRHFATFRVGGQVFIAQDLSISCRGVVSCHDPNQGDGYLTHSLGNIAGQCVGEKKAK